MIKVLPCFDEEVKNNNSTFLNGLITANTGFFSNKIVEFNDSPLILLPTGIFVYNSTVEVYSILRRILNAIKVYPVNKNDIPTHVLIVASDVADKILHTKDDIDALTLEFELRDISVPQIVLLDTNVVDMSDQNYLISTCLDGDFTFHNK